MTDDTTRPAWWNGAEQAAASQGVNPDTLWKISGIESGFGRAMGTPNGSASGPWGITNGTWAAIARQNPSLGLTDKADYSQHGRAAAALLKANTAVLRNTLGRDPTDAEQYLTWFGGVGAGPKVATAPADTPVTAIFSPAAIAANKSILGNGMTAGGLRNWAAAKMAGQHYTPGPNDLKKIDPSQDDPYNSSSGGVNWNTLQPSTPLTESEKAILDYQKNQDVWSNTHAMAEAFDHENMVGQLWRAANVPAPDPSYTPSTDAFAKDPRLAGIDKSHYAYLMNSQSDAELEQRVGNLKDELNYQQKMSEKGWGGTSMRLIASIMDPAGVALGMLSPVGATAAKYGRIAQVLGAGAEGAAISTGMEAAAPNPTETEHSYLGAAAMGFLGGTVGGGLGAVMHPHPDVAPAFKAMGDSAQSVLDDVAAGTARPWGSSAGAAQNSGFVAPVRSDTDLFTNQPFMNAELGKAAMPKVRADIAGQTKASENPLTAALGSRFVEDAVGNADHSAVNRAVSVEANLIKNREETFAAREYQDAWNDYRQRNNVPVWQQGRAELEFRERAADAIDNPDPTQNHGIDPAVQKVADTYRKFFADYHELAQNPGLVDGSEMRPLRGMENVPSDPNYFPRIYDFLGFGEHVRRFGDGQMQGLLRDSAMSINPGLAVEDATALARGLYKGLRNAQTGQEVSMSRMLSGEDQDGLRSFLGAETNMSQDQIERIIGHLNPPEQNGTIARTKRKASLNIHYEAQLRDVRTGEVVPVKIKDFTERNTVHVASLYGRQMSAQIAMARLRVENPMWHPDSQIRVDHPDGTFHMENDPSTPRYLVDGIRGPSEMQTLLKRVKAVGDDMGIHPDKTAKDVERLQFMYDAISGGSTSALDRGKLGQFIRLLKAWNFTRVMNQVGFAQLAETWTGVSQVGLRAALSGIPEMRQFFDGIRGGRDQTDLARQIEHIAEAGTEMLRGSMHVPLDDLGNRVGTGASFMDKAERILARSTRATSIMSGMAPLTAFQSKWMAKAAMARFAMDATGEKRLNMRRMAVLGIDPKMAEKIRSNLQRHDGYIEGESGTQHRLLNLDRWDPDARHAYEYALHLWVRKMIQENDLGQMNTVLGTSMGRLMGQFRMFMMAAYTKNTLHNLHIRDWETVSGVLGSTILAGLTYAARTHLNAIGRSDRDQYLAKRMDNKSIAAAAVQGGAFSSIMPMLADLGTYAMGFDPLFDARVTGTPAQGLTSNPTMSLLNSALQASRGVTATARGDGAYNQQDARALQSIMPFSNLLPVVWAANSLISGLPTQDTHKHRN